MIIALVSLLAVGIAVAVIVLVLKRKSTVELTNDEFNLLSRKKFDRFELQSFLMRGDFNTTYEALDPDRNKTVAIRVLHRNLLYNENVAQQFHFKGEMLKFLADRFPGDRFVQNINYGKARVDDELRPYIVSDYIPGVSLGTVLEKHPQLSPADTYLIVRQIGEALSLAHTQRIWIRELAPHNIILRLDESGALQASLANVGVPFKSLPSEVSAESKKAYYSPEDRKGDLVDGRSDVYALASLTYRLLEGHEFSDRPKDASWQGVSAILESALSDDPSKRTSSADGFVRTLSSLQSAASPLKPVPWHLEIPHILKGRKAVKIKKSGTEVLPSSQRHRPAYSRGGGGGRVREKVPSTLVTGFFSAVFYTIFGQINSALFSSQRKAVKAVVVAIIAIPVAIWYLLFRGPEAKISVNTDPPGAVVMVNGIAAGKTTPISKYGVDAGTLALNVKKEGYFPVDTSIGVSKGESPELSIPLKPAANLTITINPPDAVVMIDNSVIPPTGLAGTLTAVGDHELKISRAGYDAKSLHVTLRQGQNKLQYMLDSSKRQPRLIVTAAQPGAIVWIDDQLIGPAPYQNSEITPGAHKVKVASEGFQDYVRNVNIQEGKTQTVDAALTSAGSFTLVSVPPGASVIIDGSDEGLTPKENQKLTSGIHKIRLRKDGFKTFDTSIVIQQNQLTSVAKALIAYTGTLEIRVKPFGDIYIDNELVKKAESHAPNSLSVAAGHRHLKVTHPSYGTFESDVTIDNGKTTPILVDFDVFYTVSITSADDGGQNIFGKIFVDDKDLDKYTPNSLKLRTGVHRVEVRKDNYVCVGGPKTVNMDKDQQVKFTLKKK